MTPETKLSPNNDIKNKTMRPYTIIISAWGQREAGDTGCVIVQCHYMVIGYICSHCVKNKRKKNSLLCPLLTASANMFQRLEKKGATGLCFTGYIRTFL